MKAEVFIIAERCKGCGICVEVCQPGILEFSGEKNSLGYQYPTVLNSRDCLNCGLCEMLCPDFAVWATGELEEAET